MTTVTRNPFEERKLIQKPFITDLDGKPAMPPEDYWEFWRNEMPAFKMGTPDRLNYGVSVLMDRLAAVSRVLWPTPAPSRHCCAVFR